MRLFSRNAPALAILWVGGPPPTAAPGYLPPFALRLPDGPAHLLLSTGPLAGGSGHGQEVEKEQPRPWVKRILRRGDGAFPPDMPASGGSAVPELPNAEDWLPLVELVVDARPASAEATGPVAPGPGIARARAKAEPTADLWFGGVLQRGIEVAAADVFAHRMRAADAPPVRAGAFEVWLPLSLSGPPAAAEALGLENPHLATAGYARRDAAALFRPSHKPDKARLGGETFQAVPPITLRRCRDKLVTTHGMIVGADLVPEPNDLPPRLLHPAPGADHPWLRVLGEDAAAVRLEPRGATIEEEVLVLSGVSTSNYGHFLVDQIGRYLVARPYLDPAARVLVRQPRSGAAAAMVARVTEMLEAAGHDPARIIWLPNNRSAFCRRAVVVTGISEHPRWMHPTAFAAVHDLGRRAAAAVDAAVADRWRNKLVLFDRAPGTLRRMVNVEALAELCARRGVPLAVVDPAVLTFAEQAAAASAAAAVLAVMGAGATNAIFARPGTPFVVFAPDWMPGPFFHNLADLGELPYLLVRGESLAERRSEKDQPDFAVAPRDLEAALDRLLALLEARAAGRAAE